MNRGFPSLAALLGLVAIAGYQNRDKIAEMLRDKAPAGTGPAPAGAGGSGGALPGTGETGVGGFLSGGLKELVDRFTETGHGEAAQSWVKSGPNRPVAPSELERAIGPELLNDLSQQTGLSREELLSRLSRDLPNAVDQYTPHGRLPSDEDFTR